MKPDFTLVPIGGLGNRIYAICSAIVYCRQNNKNLEIIWFKDHGCNCPVKELFSINPEIKNVTLRDATFFDLILRDNPRRRNLWIPSFFQRFMYDRRIYSKEACDVISFQKKPDFGNLDVFNHIFMVNHYKFWELPTMWDAVLVNEQIKNKVKKALNVIDTKRIVGIHIRRTDNNFSIEHSPIELFIDKINEEIALAEGDVTFYLASDSFEVKTQIKDLFGDKIVTAVEDVNRRTKQGIIDAFIELNILSKTDKIYATYNSSFSELAHFIGKTDFNVLKK